MKICLLILLTLCSLKFLHADYPRLTRRGLPLPPRPPPPPHYIKKWHHHQQQKASASQHQHQMLKLHHPRMPPPTRRPIPIHMPANHNIPLGVVPAASRPVANPVRVFWKNTQTTFRTPIEKTLVQKQQKPFFSSPSVNAQEYDFHIQSNQIPTHTNPIKQVGEKGPIHTIPAPNLSLADKPAGLVEEAHREAQREAHREAQREAHREAHREAQREAHRHQISQSFPSYQLQNQHHVQQQHQYQVTESVEPLPKPTIFGNQPQQQVYYLAEQETVLPQNANPQLLGAQNTYLQNTLAVPQADLSYNVQETPEPQLNPKELYSLLNAYPQQQQVQQQILDAYQVPMYQQQTIMQQPQESYHTITPQQQEYYQVDGVNFDIQKLQQAANQPGFAYVKQSQGRNPTNTEEEFSQEMQGESESQETSKSQEFRQDSVDKSIEPEYHSFNYDEQSHSRDQRQDKNRYDSGVYQHDQDAETSESAVHATISRGPADAVAQSQYVQNFFDNRDDSGPGNNVEPDAKPGVDVYQHDPPKAQEQAPAAASSNRPGEITGAFYTSLPSKQAADTLATLQAAGKINSNLMQLTRNDPQIITSKNPMAIYVSETIPQSENSQSPSNEAKPDAQSDDDGVTSEEETEEQEYSDDYSQEQEEISEEKMQEKETFGHRLKPRKRTN